MKGKCISQSFDIYTFFGCFCQMAKGKTNSSEYICQLYVSVTKKTETQTKQVDNKYLNMIVR